MDLYGSVAVTTAMHRASTRRIGIRQFQQMDLLRANGKPRPRITQIGAIGQYAHAQHITVKRQRALRVRYQQARVRDAKVLRHDGEFTQSRIANVTSVYRLLCRR